VIVTNTLVRDYLLNYARPLIYTTSLSYPNVIAADSSFDMLENGTAQDVCYVFVPIDATVADIRSQPVG
jgi:8-amino-7-oxononanoate synthase